MRTTVIVFIVMLLLAEATVAFVQEQGEMNAGGTGGIMKSINQAQSVDVEKKLEEMQVKTSTAVEKLWLMAKAYSVPILIISFLAGAVFMLLSIFFGQAMKRVAGGIIGMGIIAFILFNYAPQLTGMVLSLVDIVLGDILPSMN